MRMTAPFRVSVIACTASALALSLAVFGNPGSDDLVERSVAGAIDRAETSGGQVAPARRLDPAHIHLSSLPAGLAPGTAVTVGDRITLAQRDGAAATFEVVEVRPIAALPGSEAGGGRDLILVTAVSAAGLMPAQTIRFVFDGDAKSPPPPARPHAL